MKLKTTLTKKVDNIDLQIINLIQEDSRLSFRNIANNLKIASGTIYNRIKSLEKRGILKNYTVIVDAAKVGYYLAAVILIQAEGKYLSHVEEDIAKISNVISVYDITGDYTIFVLNIIKEDFKKVLLRQKTEPRYHSPFLYKVELFCFFGR